MRLPFLPVVFDNFRPAPGVCVYFLSHFHTDHLTGLTPSWAAGVIYCSPITRGLLLDRFRLPADRVVALTPGATRIIPLARGSHTQNSLPGDLGLQPKPTLAPAATTDSSYADSMSMRVTVFDAPHIPGSVMIHLETCLGTYLYTGDFRWTTTNPSALPPRGFLQPIDEVAASSQRRKLKGKLPVDHLIVDDTWLHLTPTHPGFLTEEEVLREFQRITDTINRSLAVVRTNDTVSASPPATGTTVDGEVSQERVADAPTAGTSDKRTEERNSVPVNASVQSTLEQGSIHQENESSTAAEETAAVNAQVAEPTAFCLRVYLHNHFGKENILQELARMLQATIVVDERRYNYLSTIVRSELEQTSAREESQQSSGIDLSLFTTASRHGRLATASTADAGQEMGSCTFEVVTEPFPHRAIQVVPSRAWITPQSIRQARDQSGVPHFGLIMSGWAGVQKRVNLQAEEVPDVIIWRLPYSLHCTAREICAFVEAIRPLSIQSLHHSNAGDNERGVILLKKCGRFLASPGYNQPVSAVEAMRKLPLFIMKMIYATNNVPQLHATLGGAASQESMQVGRKRVRAPDEGESLDPAPRSEVVSLEGRRGVRIRSAARSDDETEREEPDWNAFDELLGASLTGEDDLHLSAPSAHCLPDTDLSVLSLLDRETSPCPEEEHAPRSIADSFPPSLHAPLAQILSALQDEDPTAESSFRSQMLLHHLSTDTSSQSESRVLSGIANFERSLAEKRCSIVL